VRVVANSPETFPFAGRRGLPIFAAPLINPPERLKAGLQAYRETLPVGAKGDTALAFSVHVTTNRAQARQDTEAGLLRFLRHASGAREAALALKKDRADYSTVTDFARLRGLSMSQPRFRATW